MSLLRKKWLLLGILATTLGIGMVYGIAIQKYHFFPHALLKTAKNYVNNEGDDPHYGPWSIGVYTGFTPFDLHDPEDISNPVLTPKDVKDVDAKFVADPFLATENGRFYLFFEILNRANNQGDIGYAESEDGKKWEYKKRIIDEPFHLSYPYVFKWEDHHYLIPESGHDLSVRLYRATSFPGDWEFLKRILHGEHYIDPSIFRYENIWWLFFSNPQNDALNLYYADELMGDWRPHPMNPIVKLNKHIARPGGRVLVHDGRIYRFTQDAEPRYGIQVFAFEIEELTKTTYTEKIVSEKPVVTMSGDGWNAYGMHHVDPHLIKGQWMAAVDGRCGPSSIPCKAFSAR
ncbi:MAG: hypothetical protein NPIRA03_33620 [Nitrospirales bacterium]|nr:MAG: hypothetical protein NPIRA03_33620 [Nitrospirales bacterium]